MREWVSMARDIALHVLVILCLLGTLALLNALGGCGASPRVQHEVLNKITDVADPTYALALEACDVGRETIKARPGTTYDEDLAAMTRVNEVCDGIVAGFESLRGSQRTARQAIDDGDATIAAAIAEALRLWRVLQELLPQLEQFGRRRDPGGQS